MRERVLAVMLSGGIAYPAVRRAVVSSGLLPVIDDLDASAVTPGCVLEMIGHPIPEFDDAITGWRQALERFCETGGRSFLLQALTGLRIGDNIATSCHINFRLGLNASRVAK